MSQARDRMVERRLRRGLGKRKPRRISVLWHGKVLTGQASGHKLPAGRLYNLRLRIWRRFHTVPLFSADYLGT